MATYIGSTEISNGYIGIPNPESIVLDKSFISMDTVWQTSQITATIEPTLSDHSITWTSDDTTVATVSTTGLVTCVTPWDCTITATTVNGLTASCSVKASKLPVGYQEVEWIGSNWMQRIKSWVSVAPWIRANIDFQITNGTSSDQAIIGYYASNSSVYRCGYWPNDWFTMSEGSFSLLRQTATGNPIAVTQNSFQLYLFAKQRYSDWTADSQATGKLFSCQMYDGSTLVRDFVPCYTTANTEIWLYDIVNNTFYTNQWGGTFTKWPDV